MSDSAKMAACHACPLPCAASESSGLPEGQRGTYAGLAAKVEHFKELGINAGEKWRQG